jgi:hypothetical protein
LSTTLSRPALRRRRPLFKAAAKPYEKTKLKKMWEARMRVINLAAAVVLVLASSARADEKPTRFWNLTAWTITDLRLAPAGTEKFGPNLCHNDKDGAVDADERLKTPGVATGAYDARVEFRNGRACRAKNLSVVDGQIFEIAEKDLVDCSK